MPVTALHQEVAMIALHAAARHGFALAGGNALIMHGVIDRPTMDVDLFTDEEQGVRTATAEVADALAGAGFIVDWQDKTGGLGDLFPGMGDGLAEWIVTAPGGEQVQLQMSYFARRRRPVVMEIGPVLDLDDVAAGKAHALACRAAIRDYIDAAALLDHYPATRLIALAQRMDPGLGDGDFADAGRRLDVTPDSVFARYGLSPEQIAWVREQFEGWPR
jgi:Nucleotidyl transferase AbiEii toxin, Type IV TA system